LQTARVGTHGVHQSGGTSNKQLAIDYRGRRKRDYVTIESKGPFELQPANPIDAQPS
jgi:hypothetical protein